MKTVLLVGAGHAHVAVLRRFGLRPLPGVRLSLLTREVSTPYSGMVPGVVAGHYSFDEAHIDAGRLRPYRPQAHALAIVSTGGRHAVLTRNGITLEGGWAWRLKDWIDRRFMARFNDLPHRPGPPSG